jgi:hypothetical protein
MLYLPFLAQSPFCQQEADNDNEQHEKLIVMLREYMRVLKPGARLITFNLVWQVKAIEKELRAQGYSHVTTSSKWYWLTTFPAKMTQCYKPNGILLQLRAFACSYGATTSRVSMLVRWRVTEPIANPDSSPTLSSITASESKESLLSDISLVAQAEPSHSSSSESEAAVASRTKKRSAISSVLTSETYRRPVTGRDHTMLRIGMAAFCTSLFILMAWATEHFWCNFLVPDRLPWHNQVLFMSSSPIHLYLSIDGSW